MRFYRSIAAFFVFIIVLVASFPIEIKDIQYLFPPQNTLLDAVGDQTYHTQIDKQVGDSQEEEERKKACVPKQNAEPSKEGEEEAGDGEGSEADGFIDNSPVNGTIVDDPMEVKIYKPECDD
ncbi:unnamed protein product [Caenorhabditis sp. 36 PRJEB53466]|nr:unnamed protein product [Caenorhabditis sp. 36 PRJEB53466]